jgi:ATP-dependent RNA circularization protein (DNA/RNA ligase family)
VCSRNLGIAREEDTSKPQTAFWAVAERYDLVQKLARNPDWVVQGEVYGPGLRKNRCKARALSLALFNIWSINDKRYLNCAEFLEAARFLGLPTVRVLEEGESFNYTVEELLEKARGKYPGTSADREGIVVRPKQEVARARMMGIGHNRLSFKVVNNDFLLKNGQ